jgi:hypothetical protein
MPFITKINIRPIAWYSDSKNDSTISEKDNRHISSGISLEHSLNETERD